MGGGLPEVLQSEGLLSPHFITTPHLETFFLTIMDNIRKKMNSCRKSGENIVVLAQHQDRWNNNDKSECTKNTMEVRRFQTARSDGTD